MADNTNRIAGVAYFSIDGVSYALAGDLEYSVALWKKETKTGQDTVHGFSAMPIPGHISASLRDTGSLSVQDLNNMDDNTITLELANGKLVVGRNMWTVDDQTVKTSESTIEVKWEGPQGCVTEN